MINNNIKTINYTIAIIAYCVKRIIWVHFTLSGFGFRDTLRRAFIGLLWRNNCIVVPLSEKEIVGIFTFCAHVLFTLITVQQRTYFRVIRTVFATVFAIHWKFNYFNQLNYN